MSQSSSQTIETKFGSYESDMRDGIRIDWDVPIPMDDVYELDVEIWPTSIVLPKGYRVHQHLPGSRFERGEAARHSRPFERPTSSISRWTRSSRGFGPA
jgi:hypothetical protein